MTWLVNDQPVIAPWVLPERRARVRGVALNFYKPNEVFNNVVALKV